MTSKVPCSMKVYSFSSLPWMAFVYFYAVQNFNCSTLHGDISKDEDAMQFRKKLECVHFSMIYF